LVSRAKDAFPFGAVVGQEEAQRALLLAAIDPAIGGVLLRGDKGSAKSTLARGLAGLLDDAPFVELPLGATEDRVLGSLDLRAALTDDADRFRPGLLASAHQGVLYVDEVNLLPDHLVDVLLDVAASGVNRVERDGLSHEHPARFLLLGSMNPEEGELRPQLLDRFGLVAEVRTPQDPVQRAAAVRRRLAHDAGQSLLLDGANGLSDGELRKRLATTAPAELPDDVVAFAARLAVEVGAESLRADLVLCRAAAALAGWEGRSSTTQDDVVEVAPLALGHRRRRRPFDPPILPPDELSSATQAASSEPAPEDGAITPRTRAGQLEEQRWEDLAGDALARPSPPWSASDDPRPRTVASDERPGRVVGSSVPGPDGPQGLVVFPSVRAALERRAADPDGPTLAVDDLREPRRASRQRRTVVLAVDASGSMGTQARVTAATGAVLGLLADAYLRRDQVALVAFRGREAEEVLPPTGSIELARARLSDLATGGPTPLAEGIEGALRVVRRSIGQGNRAVLVLLTDGRATGSDDALAKARETAREVARRGIENVVLDAEDSQPRLGLAAELAGLMGGRHLPLSEVTAGAVEAALRTHLEIA
jgi:magnesium chelatase subunit D